MSEDLIKKLEKLTDLQAEMLNVFRKHDARVDAIKFLKGALHLGVHDAINLYDALPKIHNGHKT